MICCGDPFCRPCFTPYKNHTTEKILEKTNGENALKLAANRVFV